MEIVLLMLPFYRPINAILDEFCRRSGNFSVDCVNFDSEFVSFVRNHVAILHKIRNVFCSIEVRGIKISTSASNLAVLDSKIQNQSGFPAQP
jgi:hypothetical protein